MHVHQMHKMLIYNRLIIDLFSFNYNFVIILNQFSKFALISILVRARLLGLFIRCAIAQKFIVSIPKRVYFL